MRNVDTTDFAAPASSEVRIIRLDELMRMIGLGRSTIYDRLNPKSKRYDPSFPKPIKIGMSHSAAIGWRLDGVMRWIDTLS